MAPAVYPPKLKEILNAFLDEKFASGKFPYAEDAKEVIREHLQAALHKYRGLDPKEGDYSGEYVLSAQGLIPMYYDGQRYTIHVKIFLPSQYPKVAPIVTTSPEPAYTYNPEAKWVDPDTGIITSEYGKNWGPSSTIMDLCAHLGEMFTQTVPCVRVLSLDVEGQRGWGFAVPFGVPRVPPNKPDRTPKPEDRRRMEEEERLKAENGA